MTPTNILLKQLDAILKPVVAELSIRGLKWEMISAYECVMTRTNGEIALTSSTFTISCDGFPTQDLKLNFDEQFAKQAGSTFDNDNFTLVCGVTGDISIAVGYAPSREEAEAASNAHGSNSTQVRMELVNKDE